MRRTFAATITFLALLTGWTTAQAPPQTSGPGKASGGKKSGPKTSGPNTSGPQPTLASKVRALLANECSEPSPGLGGAACLDALGRFTAGGPTSRSEEVLALAELNAALTSEPKTIYNVAWEALPRQESSKPAAKRAPSEATFVDLVATASLYQVTSSGGSDKLFDKAAEEIQAILDQRPEELAPAYTLLSQQPLRALYLLLRTACETRAAPPAGSQTEDWKACVLTEAAAQRMGLFRAAFGIDPQKLFKPIQEYFKPSGS